MGDAVERDGELVGGGVRVLGLTKRLGQLRNDSQYQQTNKTSPEHSPGGLRLNVHHFQCCLVVQGAGTPRHLVMFAANIPLLTLSILNYREAGKDPCIVYVGQ